MTAKVDTWTGPRCYCGKPGRYPENGRPKCGHHNLTRRAEKERWRKVLKEIQNNLTLEEARECVRMAVANKLVSQEQGA